MTKEMLGKRLKQLRQRKHLTQQEVADKIGQKSKSTISMWEIGKSEPDVITFLTLCCEYGLPEAKALVQVLELEEAVSLSSSLLTQEDPITVAPQNTRPFIFCPYCGEKLKQ